VRKLIEQYWLPLEKLKINPLPKFHSLTVRGALCNFKGTIEYAEQETSIHLLEFLQILELIQFEELSSP